MTGYLQSLDMGYFSTVKKRFRSFRRTYMKSPTYTEIIKKVANLVTGFTPEVVICFWKVVGLIDECDTERIGGILDLHQ